MAAPKKQESRFSSSLETGPMKTRGDLAAMKDPLTPKARNCFRRRGRVRVRDAYTQDGSAFTTTVGANEGRDFFVWDRRSTGSQSQSSSQTLFMGMSPDPYTGFGRPDGFYKIGSGGTWTTNSAIRQIFSLTEYDGTAYFSTGPASTETQSLGNIASFNGTTFNSTIPFATNMFSKLLTTFGGRVLAAGCRFQKTASETGLNYKIDHDDNTKWTVGGTGATQPVKTGTDVVWTIQHATDNYVEYTASSSVMYTATYTGWHTIVQWVKPVEPDKTVPLKLEVRDSAAGTVLYTNDYNVVQTTTDPEWQPIATKVQLTSGDTITLRIYGGNGHSSATVGDQVQLAVNHGNAYGDMYGVNVYTGTFILDEPLSRPQVTTSGYAGDWIIKDNFVYWSDPLTPDEWIASNYITLDDKAGPFTSINVVNGKIVITRSNAVYVLRPILGEEGVDQAFVFENSFHMPGPLSQKATILFRNTLFYVAEDNVYAFNGDGDPQEVLDASIKDEVFPVDSSSAAYECNSIAIDHNNDELYILTDQNQSRLYVYSLEEKAVTGYIEAPDFGGANNEPPSGTNHSSVFWDVVWCFDRLNVIVHDFNSADYTANSSYVMYIDSSATQDTIAGNTNYVWAEYQFKPQESETPRSAVTVQRFGIKHSITGDQTNASVKFRISTDYGANWKYAQRRLTRLATATLPSSTRTCRYFIHKTGNKFLFSVVYNGPSGEAYFNLESGLIDGILRGRENQNPHDTKVATGTE